MPDQPADPGTSAAGRSATDDYRLTALATLVPRPAPGSRALVVDIQSAALRDAIVYLGASVTAAQIDIDAGDLVFGSVASDAPAARVSPSGSAFDLAIADVRGWGREGVSAADQRDLLAKIRGSLRPGGAC